MKAALKYAAANPQIAGGVALVLIAAAWILLRGSAQAGKDLGGAAVGLANGVVSGTVEGIGGLFGLPATDIQKGNEAVASGDWLGASAYLPAPQFVAAAAQNASTSIQSAANNPDANPLQPVGAAIGGWVYDMTHTKANGGMW